MDDVKRKKGKLVEIGRGWDGEDWIDFHRTFTAFIKRVEKRQREREKCQETTGRMG